MVELTAFQRERVRRSQRVSLAVPVLLTSLDPKITYSESCRTFTVNRHGCGLRAPQPLAVQTPVRLDVGPGKASAQARVVMCAPAKDEKDVWEMGIELDSPENIWGIQFPPSDWITGKSAEPLRRSAPPPPPVQEPKPAPTASTSAEATAAVAMQSIPPSPAPPELVPAAVATAQPNPAATVASVEPSPPPVDVAEPAQVEVSFSLEDMAPPTAAPEAAPPVRETPPPWPAPETLQELEGELRQRARAIAAEFEEDYRRSLGELLMRLRADLEEQTAADWERNRQGALESLQAVAEKIREQLELESATRATSDAARAAQLEEIRQARDYVESLIRVLPETIDHHLQEALSARAEQWQNRLNEEHAARTRELRAQLQEHSKALTDELAAQARQRLFDDLDRHEREFLDRLTVRLEEVRASADHTREFTKRTSADIARQSEQLRVNLQTQFDSLFEEHRRDLARTLEERHERLNHAALTALQNLGGRLWESLRQQLNADFETRTQELRQTLQTAQAETRHLREHTERLAVRLDTGLQARLDQAVDAAANRAQSRFEQQLAAAHEEDRRRLESERERADALRAQMQQVFIESLQAQQTALLAEFKRETEAVAADSRVRFQEAMQQTLNSIGEILGPKPTQPGTNFGPGAKEL